MTRHTTSSAYWTLPSPCNRNPRRLKHSQQMSPTYQHDMVIHGLESDVSQKQKTHCMILDLCLHHLSPSFFPGPPRPATSAHFVDMYWCNGRRRAKQHLLSAQLTNVVPCRQIGGDWRPENWEAGIHVVFYIYIYIVIINYNIYIYIYMRGETPSLSLAKLPWNWSRSIATNLQKIPENGWPQFPNLHHFTNLQKIMQNQNTNQYHPKYTFGAVRCVRRQRQPLPSSWLAPRMEHFFRMKTVSLQRRCALPVAGVRVPTRSE